jgi:hypothetical protein
MLRQKKLKEWKATMGLRHTEILLRSQLTKNAKIPRAPLILIVRKKFQMKGSLRTLVLAIHLKSINILKSFKNRISQW